MVHTIQLNFHKDPAKIRLFLGGNRCLAEGTQVLCPNNKTIRIENIREGDIVLSVNPSTLETAPCVVEKTYNNGEQRVTAYSILMMDSKEQSRLRVTDNHLIYTPKGLRPAATIHGGSTVCTPSTVYYAGSDVPYSHILGYLLSTLKFEDYKPYALVSEKTTKILLQLMGEHKIPGYIRRLDNGMVRLYGALARYVVEHVKPPNNYRTHIRFAYNNKAIKQFLDGLISTKLRWEKQFPVIATTNGPDAKLVFDCLRSMGIYSAACWDKHPQDNYKPVYVSAYRDWQKILDELHLPLVRDKLSLWLKKEKFHHGVDGDYFEKKITQWITPDTRKVNKYFSTPVPTYDIKLAGGHNLFVAEDVVVGNSGKTEGGAVEAYWFMSGTHPYKENIPIPNTGRILCENLDQFAEDIMPKFAKWAPNFDAWKPIKGHQGKIAGFRLPNGSKFHVYTFDQKFGKLEGSSFLWCWANEPPPKSHVVACLRGLIDLGGFFWFTLTPLSEPYLYNDFYVPATSQGRKDIGIHEASIHDNPWLKEEDKKILLENISDDERQAREFGKFRHLLGRVFKAFDRPSHVIPWHDWPSSWPVTIGIDPHLRKDQIAVFVGMSRKGWYVALDEICCSGDLEEFGYAIIEKVRARGFSVQKIMADTLINQVDKRFNLPDVMDPKNILDDIFVQAGLPKVKAAKKRDTKWPFISEMQRLLKVIEWPKHGRTKDGKILRGPQFYVIENCSGLITDFMNYVYKEHRRPEILGESEEPIKKWDDYLDALKYAMLADPGFESRVRHKKSRRFETYTGVADARKSTIYPVSNTGTDLIR